MSHSPNLDKLDQEASMQNIDRLVEALEMEAKESRMSKRRKLFSDEASSSTLQVYQPLDREEPSTSIVQVYQSLKRLIVPSFPNFGITLEELSMLSRDEVFPYVNTHKLKTDGILKISGRKYKKDVWQDIAPWFGFSLTHSQPRSEGWVVDDFKKFSLDGHPDGYVLDKQVRLVINQVLRMVGRLDHDRNNKFSGDKFREGWQAIVRIVTADFLAKQAIARHEPLLLEACNAFTNTKDEWDNKKGELVRERKALKEELNKAKEMAA
ncbi:hypothetical protein R1flu_026460 [Riccia fluitans]|uniref:Uncharacterized protein n=1 Tax=Riccia fluitans TaxID=41844 RepID=A0ABD1XG14_9MARC